MSMMILISDDVYKDLFVVKLPENVINAFYDHAEKVIGVAVKYALTVTEDDEELLDLAQTRIYQILRFCYIAKVVPTIETIVSLLHESEENLALSDFFFYDNTDDSELAANKIVYIAMELMNDVREAMTIDLD